PLADGKNCARKKLSVDYGKLAALWTHTKTNPHRLLPSYTHTKLQQTCHLHIFEQTLIHTGIITPPCQKHTLPTTNLRLPFYLLSPSCQSTLILIM
uniref:Uncharacterized protein n=1 Tax=Mastacembelus armatus TaxID=205130 RepID=A0A3Q3MUK9_9TELE